MKADKFDLLLRAPGWRGSLARVSLLTIVYVCVMYVPVAIEWAAENLGMTPMSEAQRLGYPGILFGFRLLWLIAIVVEAAYLIFAYLVKKRRIKNSMD
ncbi:hypothetical protein [Paraburkholderia bonniea]|uniref:hypothetical protein n=1 Tax=Paraburkholderia bonniea TaxID=2152891 RepID=UPI00129218C4|nr:hypothetical protein [Paraburkholderia bonniea]